MFAEATLLAAVLTDLHADDPREALARWWRAAGDPRGEFVALQLEIVREMRKWLPAWAWKAQETRCGSLLDSHGPAWAGPIASRVRRYRFIRGFVEEIEIAAADFLEDAAELVRLAPIRHLILHQVASHAVALAGVPQLAQLVSLTVTPGDGLDDDAALALVRSPHLGRLRWLDLRGQRLTRGGLGALVTEPNLRELDVGLLAGNELPDLEEVEQRDWDGTPVAIRDGGGILTLEAAHGTVRWLHARANRTTFELHRDAF